MIRIVCVCVCACTLPHISTYNPYPKWLSSSIFCCFWFVIADCEWIELQVVTFFLLGALLKAPQVYISPFLIPIQSIFGVINDTLLHNIFLAEVKTATAVVFANPIDALSKGNRTRDVRYVLQKGVWHSGKWNWLGVCGKRPAYIEGSERFSRDNALSNRHFQQLYFCPARSLLLSIIAQRAQLVWTTSALAVVRIVPADRFESRAFIIVHYLFSLGLLLCKQYM